MAGPTSDIIPIFGFQVERINILPGRGEEDTGKIRIILEAPKDDLRASDHDFNAMLGAMNMHHSTKEPIAIQVRI